MRRSRSADSRDEDLAGCHVLEFVAIDPHDRRIGHTGKDDKLAVAVGKLVKKIEQVLFGGDTVVFAANQEYYACAVEVAGQAISAVDSG